MICFHDENLWELNRIKRGFVLAFLVTLLLFLAACGGGGTASDQTASSLVPEQDSIKIEITAPSASELTIAPGHHFKVAGKMTGEVPDRAVLKVSLLDEAGSELRYAATDHKGTDRVVPSVVGGKITTFVEDTDFSEVAYTAPEMVVADIENPDASAHDATVKCVYTDETFFRPHRVGH